jgi:trimeric autotransporter adhesin
MNAPVAAHLGDNLLSAATAKSGLHKSMNKEDLSAATSEAFSKLLLAAQANGASPVQPQAGKQTQDPKAKVSDESAVKTEPAAVPPTLINPSASTAVLNPASSYPVLSPPIAAGPSGKDIVASGSESDKSKVTSRHTDKPALGSATDSSSSSQVLQAKVESEPILAPVSLPSMPPAELTSLPTAGLPSMSSAAVPGAAAVASKSSSPLLAMDKSVAGSSDSGTSNIAKVPSVDLSTDKTGSKRSDTAGTTAASTTAAQGQQSAWASYRVAGAFGEAESAAGATVGGASADQKVQAAGATSTSGKSDTVAPKSGLDGASGVVSSATASAAVDITSAAAGTPATPTPDAKTDSSTLASKATATPGPAVGPVGTVHDAVPGAAPLGAHETPAAATSQSTQHDTSAPAVAARMDASARSTPTNPGPGNANAHALLDGASPSGREGTWQISPNRVEAGYANGQDSWTSVIAQRQQGHVTAMLELGSAAEHGSTVSMLPQLNAHLAERQVPVDQLGASVRQQFSSGQGASDPNQPGQGQQPAQSSQPQRSPLVGSSPVSGGGIAPAGIDGGRISIQA